MPHLHHCMRARTCFSSPAEGFLWPLEPTLPPCAAAGQKEIPPEAMRPLLATLQPCLTSLCSPSLPKPLALESLSDGSLLGASKLSLSVKVTLFKKNSSVLDSSKGTDHMSPWKVGKDINCWFGTKTFRCLKVLPTYGYFPAMRSANTEL